MIRHTLHFGAFSLLVLAATAASAADSFTKSLTGFTGNSTLVATQTAVASPPGGFTFTSTAGAGEDPPGTPIDPTVQFDANGAHFGDFFFGDAGRNFMRTVASDYGNVSFVAEVTWETIDISNQSAYFGLGAAEYGNFRIADWNTQFSSVQLFLEVAIADPRIFTSTNSNGRTTFDGGTDAPGLETGTNRLRLTYDWFRKQAEYSIDLNYAGGPFVADVTAPPVGTLGLYGADGWSTEPAKLYFGGDDGSVFKDFQVTVSTPSMILGDFNNSGTVTADDWVILRTNQKANLSSMTFSQAYFLGDMNGDLANDHADFTAFKTIYEGVNGVGSFAAMVAGVPEPSTIALALLSLGFLPRPATRRASQLC